ncbi:hypothetical protein KP509_33G031500 [Ceratopteris richardii]|uniref:RING-CH-type domain-containing protein n=1 Tax=Ceratopteris richardii TaxID=49495 RepID=A0A8T2QNW2_CERRI|nr:hypothetical protein KP509_33G031500 [Ceratopteris richardii]
MTRVLEPETRENAVRSVVSDAPLSPAVKSEVNETAQLEIEIDQLHLQTTGAALHAASCDLKVTEALLDVCRICQCFDADKVGERALKILDITVPPDAIHRNPTISLETSPTTHGDRLIELGCDCKNDLALTHYACALRWFASRDSDLCEICGAPSVNVRSMDRKKVSLIIKGKNAHQRPDSTIAISNREASSARGDSRAVCILPNATEDLVSVLAWFDPSGNSSHNPATFYEQGVDIPSEGPPSSSPATRWAVEVSGIIIATGLLTVTITWLLSSRIDKTVARGGLNVLLGGLSALSIVVFLRFVSIQSASVKLLL